MRQREKLLKIMLDNPEKKIWYAKDFQNAPYFIGYEATARMSEIALLFDEIVEIGKDGKFRTLSIKWDKEKEIKDIKVILEEIGDEE